MIVAPTNGTDAASAIQTSLNSGVGSYFLGSTSSVTYTLTNPIIVPNGVALIGRGAMQGGTTLQASASFPHTTTTGFTTPASTSTTFTMTVASTAGFPLGTGGITPPAGTGVLCVAGITVFYTGTTSTTFTGCRVAAGDLNVTVANGRNVSTFMVWLCEPAASGAGFGTYIENIGIDCNSVAGISGIHSSHVQEGGGWRNIRVTKFANFGMRFDSNPSSAGSDQAVNYRGEKAWIIFSSSAEAEAVGIDVMQSFVGAGASNLDSDRGIKDVSFVVQGSAVIVGKAAIRLNAATGSYGDFHIENMNIGVLVGDVFRSSVNVDNVWVGNAWGTTGGGVLHIGNISGNTVRARNLGKTNAASHSALNIVNDQINNFQIIDEQCDYEVLPTGCYRVNGGGMYGTTAQRPTASSVPGAVYFNTTTGHASISGGASVGWQLLNLTAGIKLAQDSVAAGARDNSSASTLTVTFTKATTAGNHAIIECLQSGNFVLSSIVDSRGNTWQVDKTQSGQGTTANIASCHIGTGHQIGDTLTLTFSGASTYAAATVQEFSGLATSSWLDQTGGQSAASGTTATTLATSTRTQADELLVGALAYNSASAPTAGAGFQALTAQSSGAGNRKIAAEYRVVSVVGTDAATWTTSGFGYDSAIATYKAANSTA